VDIKITIFPLTVSKKRLGRANIQFQSSDSSPITTGRDFGGQMEDEGHPEQPLASHHPIAKSCVGKTGLSSSNQPGAHILLQTNFALGLGKLSERGSEGGGVGEEAVEPRAFFGSQSDL
jgi:hypothetical protein